MSDLAEKLDRAELIGRGYTADIYAWGAGRVLKLFHGSASDRAEREYRITRAVHAAGLPAPEPFQLVTVKERRGIVFQRLEGISMLDHFQRTPWKIFAAVRQLADLQTQIHATAGSAELPSQRQRLAEGIMKSAVLSAAEKGAAQAALSVLPDGTATCHGDFHPANVMFTAKGPVVIDWGAASRGDAFGDVACTARLIRIARLPPWKPWHMHQILRCSRVLLHRSYTRRLLRHHGATLEQLRKWGVPVAAAATFWLVPQAILLNQNSEAATV